MTQDQLYAVMMRLSGNMMSAAGKAQMGGDTAAANTLKGISDALFQTATDVIEDPEIAGEFGAKAKKVRAVESGR